MTTLTGSGARAGRRAASSRRWPHGGPHSALARVRGGGAGGRSTRRLTRAFCRPTLSRAAPWVRSIRLGFLGAWPFRCEDPRSRALDYLGFSCPNLYFSMGYAVSGAKIFSRAPLRGGRPDGTEACGLGMWKRRIVHEARLILFLIFCNRLLCELFPFGRPQIQKQLASAGKIWCLLSTIVAIQLAGCKATVA
jgi:hypothetical protein